MGGELIALSRRDCLSKLVSRLLYRTIIGFIGVNGESRHMGRADTP